MTIFDQVLLSEFTYRVGVALLQSTWQVLIVAVILGFVLRIVPKEESRWRYRLSCLALLSMFGWFVATLAFFPPPANLTTGKENSTQVIASGSQTTAPTTNLEELAIKTGPAGADPEPWIERKDTTSGTPVMVGNVWSRWMPMVLSYLTPIWIACVLGISLWRLGGWVLLWRLRSRGTSPVPTSVENLAQELKGRLKVTRSSRVLQSLQATTPLVIGAIRPLILLPVAVVSELSLAQIESILAHELAHIRRNDYLVNLLQTAIETVLFYHPGVWWMSQTIRREREFCSDDLALSVIGDRVPYAQALAKLAEMQVAHSGLAVAASDGALLDRIRRVAGQASPRSSNQTVSVSGLILVFFGILLLLTLLSPNLWRLNAAASERIPVHVADDEGVDEAISKDDDQDVNGVYTIFRTMIDENGKEVQTVPYSWPVLELNDGKFRYWHFSDSVSPDVKFPVQGDFSMEDGALVLEHEKLLPSNRYVPATIKGISGLWTAKSLRVWKTEKQVVSHEILVRVANAPLNRDQLEHLAKNDYSTIPKGFSFPSIKPLYDAESIKRFWAKEKQNYELRYSDLPEPLRTLLRKKTRKDDGSLVHYKKAIERLQKKMDRVLIEQLVGVMGKGRHQVMAPLVLNDIFVKSSLIPEQPIFTKSMKQRQRALTVLVDAIPLAKDGEALAEILLVFLEASGVHQMNIDAGDTKIKLSRNGGAISVTSFEFGPEVLKECHRWANSQIKNLAKSKTADESTKRK